MTDIDPNLWASLARQYTGGINAPVTGQVGYLARVNADSNNLEYVSGADLLRTVYDFIIDEVELVADAFESWIELDSWPLADIAPNTTSRAITICIHVTQVSSGYDPQDVVYMHAVYGRFDAANDVILNDDSIPAIVDEGPNALVEWELELKIAGHFVPANNLLEMRLREDGTDLILEVRRHATTDRLVHAEIYLENY